MANRGFVNGSGVKTVHQSVTIASYKSVYKLIEKCSEKKHYEQLLARIQRLGEKTDLMAGLLKSILEFKQKIVDHQMVEKIQTKTGRRNWTKQFLNYCTGLYSSQSALAMAICFYETQEDISIQIMNRRIQAVIDLLVKATDTGYIHFTQPMELNTLTIINMLLGKKEKAKS